jgi:hypothetical protein
VRECALTPSHTHAHIHAHTHAQARSALPTAYPHSRQSRRRKRDLLAASRREAHVAVRLEEDRVHAVLHRTNSDLYRCLIGLHWRAGLQVSK